MSDQGTPLILGWALGQGIMAIRSFNEPAEIPRELDKWNWGAFFLNWIWGIGNRTYIAFLMFVPLVNLVMIFVLGARGSAWAWENKPWRDVEHFKRTQRAWAIWGLVSWIAVIGLCVWLVFGIIGLIKGSEPYRMTMEMIRADPQVQAAVGDNITDGFATGSINFSNLSGTAEFSIPVQGTKGSATVLTRALRTNGQWQLRLVVVTVPGQPPIVLVNLDNVQVGGATTA